MSPRTFIKLSVAAALAAAAASALADAPSAPDVANWKCELCPFDKGTDGSFTLGAAEASGANASYGHYYNGMDHQGVYAEFDAEGNVVGEKGQHVEYAVDDLALSTRRGYMRVGTYGLYDLTLRYDGIPSSSQDTTVTPYSGGVNQSLPSAWIPAGTPAGMSALTGALHTASVGTERRTYGVDGRLRGSHGVTYFARFERQEKTGSEIVGAGFLTQSVQLIAPLTYTTDTVEAGIDWADDHRSVKATFSDSKFHDSDALFGFQDPYLTLSGTTTFGAVSRPPDTDARQWSVTGASQLPLHSSVSVAMSQSQLTNDAALVPAIAGGAVPTTGYDGRVVLTHMAVTASSHPWANWSARGRVSYDERRDDSTTAVWQQYLTDLVPGATVQNPHYGFERAFADGSLDWQLFRQLSLGIAGERRDVNRTDSVVANTADGRSYGRARWSPGHGIELTVKGGFAHREASGVDVSKVLTGQDPRVSIYNVANRDRDFGELNATWSGQRFTLSAQASSANDRYGRSVLGLLEGRERRAAGTLTWTPSETLSTYVDGGYQRRTSTQASAYSTASPLWFADISDRYTHAGAGGRWVLGPWDYSLDYTHARAYGNTAVGAFGGLAAFPEEQTSFESYRFTINYAKSDALTLKVRWAYQNYFAADWANDGVTPTSLTNLLAVGAVSPQHNVNVVGVSFTYRYGKRAGNE